MPAAGAAHAGGRPVVGDPYGLGENATAAITFAINQGIFLWRPSPPAEFALTRFECPRCQHVFVAETSGDEAFADCPECASLALPTGEATATDQMAARSDERAITSADEFLPPMEAQRPGIFTDLVGAPTSADQASADQASADQSSADRAFEHAATAVHAGESKSKMPSSLFTAPPSLEGAPVDESGPSPFTIQEEEPEDEDLYRAATEAYTPPSALGADAPWAGLPTPSSDGPAVAPAGADALPTLTPMVTEVDERPAGLASAEDSSSDGMGAFASSLDAQAPADDAESVFSSPDGEAIRPSLTIEDGQTPSAQAPATEESEAPAGLIVDPGLLAEPPAAEPAAEPAAGQASVASSFGELDAESTDLMGTQSPPASLEQINASQDGDALDDGNAAALFAGASFDDLEAAFDEAAERPGQVEEDQLSRAENALRQTSDADVLYERPPDHDDDGGLGVPSAPSAPSVPVLTLKKAAALPHLSLSQSTIEACALPLHGGSFVSEVSAPHMAAHGLPDRGRNPALDEETLVTRDRETTDPTGRRRRKAAEIDVSVPSVWAGLTPLRVGAVLFFACVLGTVLGVLIAPGKADRPITNRVRAEDQFAQGNRAYEAGKLDDALGYYRGAIARDNTFGLGHRAMGTVFAKQNRGEEAAKAYRTYLELTPGAVDYEQVVDLIARFDPALLPKSARAKGAPSGDGANGNPAADDDKPKADAANETSAAAKATNGDHG